MRKVIYEYWIPSRKVMPTGGSEPGTGCFSGQQSGYFHGWGQELHEDGNSIASETIALIEDCTTGHMHKVYPHKMRFVQPMTREHSLDAAKESALNISVLDIYKEENKILHEIVKQLEALNKKLAVS